MTKPDIAKPVMTRKDFWTNVIAGVSVFLSMSYVAFANPILMSTGGKISTAGKHYGMSGVAVFFATCAVAALATFVSGRYANSPAALAPGLALSAVLSDYLVARDTTLTWESALIDCGFAGLLLLFLSISGHRRQIIDSIPSIIKKAIMAGIGSVLAKKAIDFVVSYPAPRGSKFAALLFSIGLLVIVMGYFGLRLLAIKMRKRPGAEARNELYAMIFDLFGRASFIFSIIILALIVWHVDRATLAAVPQGSLIAWSDSILSAGEMWSAAVKPEAWSLVVLIFYILMIDIIGSPYHLASLDRGSFSSEPFEAEEEERIKRSFLVDSIMNMLAPLAGSTPVVYYAENIIAKVLGARDAVVAYAIVAGFLLLIAAGLVLWTEAIPLTYFVPQIAVAPVLFVVGLIIMSESLKPDKTKKPPEDDAAKVQSYSASEVDLIELVPRIPAPLAIVLTPLAGFEIGIAAGIIFYAIFQWMVPEETRQTPGKEDSNVTLFLIAAALFSIAIRAWLFFSSS